MAKDAKGHGSEKRGGVSPSNRAAIQNVMNALAARPSVGRHAQASVGVPMTDAERAQKMTDWRDKGTSDAQVREGVRALFNLPSREKLDPSNNDHVNAVLRGNASAAPRIQPRAGQIVAAGLTGSVKG